MTFFLFVCASVQFFITLLIKGRWRRNRDVFHQALKSKPGLKKNKKKKKNRNQTLLKTEEEDDEKEEIVFDASPRSYSE